MNAYGVAIRYQREDLNLKAQVILLLILHNIRPSSHTSKFTMDNSQLIYLNMKGKQVDVARIVADEIKVVAESGKQPGERAKSTCPLVFPCLIMGLI